MASRLNNRVLATPEAQLRARPDVSQGELIRVTDSTGVGFPAPKKVDELVSLRIWETIH